MVTFICYNVLRPTLSKSQEFCFVHCFDARIPPLIDVFVCISPRESFWVIGSAPQCGACDGCVPIFDVKAAWVAHIPVGKVLNEVWLVRTWCWWCDCATTWGHGYKAAINASYSTSSLLRLHTHVIGKWSALVLSTSSPQSTSSPRPAAFPSSCIESTCIRSSVCCVGRDIHLQDGRSGVLLGRGTHVVEWHCCHLVYQRVLIGAELIDGLDDRILYTCRRVASGDGASGCQFCWFVVDGRGVIVVAKYVVHILILGSVPHLSCHVA